MRAPGVVDTRALFRPLHAEWMALLRGLAPADWERPTVAGAWTVRDVVAHVLDGTLRRLSSQRDGLTLPAPAEPIDGFAGLVAYLNALNAEWVRVARHFSPRVLVDLHAPAGEQLADFFETLDPLAPAFWPVLWAGESESLNWMDVGRDFTEWWHHQQQVRDAVAAPPLTDPRWLAPLLALSLRALPRAYAGQDGAEGDALGVQIDGPAGGSWALARERGRWRLYEGEPPAPRARVSLDADTAWRLFFKALPRDEAERRVTRAGETRLADAFLSTLAVMA